MLCNVVSTLFQRRGLTLYQRCATLKIRRRILFHFQRRINIISTFIHNVETTLTDFEMSAGLFPIDFICKYLITCFWFVCFIVVSSMYLMKLYVMMLKVIYYGKTMLLNLYYEEAAT